MQLERSLYSGCSGLMATSQKCNLGISERHFHTNAGLIFLRCCSLAALCKSLPTCCPSAFRGHSNLEQNLSHQHLTHNQKQHLYTLRSIWQKTLRSLPRLHKQQLWRLAVYRTSVCRNEEWPQWGTTSVSLHFLKSYKNSPCSQKSKGSVTESYQINILTSNTMSVISMVNSLFRGSFLYYSEIY